METINTRLNLDSTAAEAVSTIAELVELELVLVGGGIGDVVGA